MKAVIYILTAFVVVCDLLFAIIVALAMRPEQGANMVLMAAAFVVWPSVLASVLVLVLLKGKPPAFPMHKVFYKLHAASCLSLLYLPFVLEFFVFRR